MPSEKMRYWQSYPANDVLQESGLPQKARAFLAQSSSDDLKPFVSEIVDIDDSNNYMLISHILDLNAEEVQLLLEAAIEHAKGRGDIIPEYDEQMLWRMIVPILERSKQWSKEGRFTESVEPVLVILIRIEKETANVEDEGFTLQLLVEDCFKALKEIALHPYDAAVAGSLKKLCIRYNQQRDEDDSYYDDEWNDVTDALCRL